jgi:hypothetical protein
MDEFERWTQTYQNAVYIGTDACQNAPFEKRAREIARHHRWKFSRLPGDNSLLKQMLSGHWDDEHFWSARPATRLPKRTAREKSRPFCLIRAQWKPRTPSPERPRLPTECAFSLARQQ